MISSWNILKAKVTLIFIGEKILNITKSSHTYAQIHFFVTYTNTIIKKPTEQICLEPPKNVSIFPGILVTKDSSELKNLSNVINYPLHWGMHVCMLSCFSHVQLFVMQRTVTHQVPPSMGFSRQEYWSGLLKCPEVSFSRGSSLPRDRTRISYISCIDRLFLYH